MSSDSNDSRGYRLESAIPIIVLGRNRSGTKWLSNIIANHGEVACVTGHEFGGILETNMFDIASQKFNLRYSDDYAAFIELWTHADYFLRTGIDRDWFIELLRRNNWPRGFLDIFELLITAYANQQNKRYWLQKSHPANALQLVRRFSDAKVVIIHRGVRETIRSTRQQTANSGESLSQSAAVYRFVMEGKMLRRAARESDACSITYEDMVESPEDQIRAVCSYIGIDFSEDLLAVPFKKNTSFGTSAKSLVREGSALSRFVLMALSHAVPLAMAKAYSRAKAAAGRSGTSSFVPDTFANLKGQLGL